MRRASRRRGDQGASAPKASTGRGWVEAQWKQRHPSPSLHFHTFKLFIYCLYNLLSPGSKYYRLPRDNQNITVRRGLQVPFFESVQNTLKKVPLTYQRKYLFLGTLRLRIVLKGNKQLHFNNVVSYIVFSTDKGTLEFIVNALTLHPMERFHGTLTLKEPSKESPLLVFFGPARESCQIEEHNLGSKSNHTLLSITKILVLLA